MFTQGWLLQSVPTKILYADALLCGLRDFVQKKVAEANVKLWGQSGITKRSDAQTSTSPCLLNSSCMYNSKMHTSLCGACVLAWTVKPWSELSTPCSRSISFKKTKTKHVYWKKKTTMLILRKTINTGLNMQFFFWRSSCLEWINGIPQNTTIHFQYKFHPYSAFHCNINDLRWPLGVPPRDRDHTGRVSRHRHPPSPSNQSEMGGNWRAPSEKQEMQETAPAARPPLDRRCLKLAQTPPLLAPCVGKSRQA